MVSVEKSAFRSYVTMNVNPINYTRQLVNYFEQFCEVPEVMANLIHQETSILDFKKRKHLVSPLDNAPDVYFILSGSVRGFDRSGKSDITSWIAVEGELVGLTLHSSPFVAGRAQYIETLEPSRAIVIPNSLIKRLFDGFPEMGIIGRKLLWQHHHDAENRNYLTRLTTAEKRVKRMIDTQPHLYYRIPMKYLASYLCMRIETLCRLRAQLATGSL